MPIQPIWRCAVAALALLLGIGAGTARAEDPNPVDPMAACHAQGVYGAKLMTPGECAQYSERLRAAGSDQEREAIRSEHQEAMRQRAAEKGVRMYDEAPASGATKGKRPAAAPGKGSGQGRGPVPGKGGGGSGAGPVPGKGS